MKFSYNRTVGLSYFALGAVFIVSAWALSFGWISWVFTAMGAVILLQAVLLCFLSVVEIDETTIIYRPGIAKTVSIPRADVVRIVETPNCLELRMVGGEGIRIQRNLLRDARAVLAALSD